MTPTEPPPGSGGPQQPSGPTFESLTLDPPALSLVVGGTAALVATPRDRAGGALSGAPAPNWSSSGGAVSVSAGGVVTAISAGTATVTATMSHLGETRTASAQVLVSGGATQSTATVRGIHHGFSPQSVTIAAGGTVTWVMDDDEHDITWDSIAPPGGNIPRPDRGERISRTFPAPGTYTYRCAHHHSRVEAGSVVVQGVGVPEFTAVTVSPNPASVAVGGTVQLVATPRDQFGAPLSGAEPAAWSSGDPTRATVSGSGVVTGVAAGTATISASIQRNGVTRTGSVTVAVGGSGQPTTASVRTVERTFSPSTVTIARGGSVTWQFDDMHNVTFSGSGPTGGNIGNTSSGAVTRQFPGTGSFPYTCTLHNGMNGTVIVQ